MLNKVIKISLIIFLIFFSLSCINNAAKSPSRTLIIPRTSFVKTEVYIVVEACTNDKDCSLKKTELLSGSGFVVGAGRNGSYIMTAGHVCDADYITSSRFDMPKKFNLEFYALTPSMKKYQMEILAIDTENDLCLAHAAGLKKLAIPISRVPPRPGDKIYNVAAPNGVMFRGAPIIIEGIYTGRGADRNHDIYTMLVAGGSSGSPIMNDRGEVIGVVSMRHTGFPFLAFSPPFENMREFVYRLLTPSKS